MPKVKRILIALFLCLVLLSQFSITALAGPNNSIVPAPDAGGSSGGSGGGARGGPGEGSGGGPGCHFEAP